jgi:hypothetical protein
MARVLIYLILLLALAGAAGAVYAVFAELPPPTRPAEIVLPGATLR